MSRVDEPSGDAPEVCEGPNLSASSPLPATVSLSDSSCANGYERWLFP